MTLYDLAVFVDKELGGIYLSGGSSEPSAGMSTTGPFCGL